MALVQVTPEGDSWKIVVDGTDEQSTFASQEDAPQLHAVSRARSDELALDITRVVAVGVPLPDGPVGTVQLELGPQRRIAGD